MERLRGPDGCPWDREQTLASLAPFIIEEAYEVVAAIDGGDAEELREELGDLLFQVVFASEISASHGGFEMADVIEGCVEKMTRRHPHVFGGETASTSAEVLDKWAEIKRTEKRESAALQSCLDGVPESLPALMRAHKLSKKAAGAGFDWPDAGAVLEKVEEEVGEFKEAVLKGGPEAIEAELGDVLFTLVNVARHFEVDPEEALRRTIGRFITRFHHVEREIKNAGMDLGTAGIEEMERLWNEAKSLETP